MSKPTMRGIDHVGVAVPDIEAATTFLVEAFGAEVIYQSVFKDGTPVQGPEIEQHTDLAPGTQIRALRMIRMRLGPDIELFEMHGPEQRPPVRSSDFGLTHLAFYADDPQVAVARFEKAGGVMFMPPTKIPVATEEGAHNSFCYGRTPWGMLIEFISYPDAMAYEKNTALRRWHSATYDASVGSVES